MGIWGRWPGLGGWQSGDSGWVPGVMVAAPLHVPGRMDANGIVRWMQRRAGPSATLLQDTDTAAAFISAQDMVVVGFFKVGQGPGRGWARARAGLMVGPCRT